MYQTATSHLRRLLRSAQAAATAQSLTLLEALAAAETAVGELIAGGQISNVSKNSASQSYAFGSGNLTTSAVAEAWSELILLFERCKDCLSAAGSDTSDASVAAEMAARLRPQHATRPDLTLLHVVR